MILQDLEFQTELPLQSGSKLPHSKGVTSGSTTIPEIIGWFPTENLLNRDAVRLIPESVLGLPLLKSGYVGQYNFGKGFLVHETSPEAAGAIMIKVREKLGQTTIVKIADDAFTASDKYVNGMCVFRKGSYIGGFADLKSGKNGVAESSNLADRIK